MISKSFWGLIKPEIKYDLLDESIAKPRTLPTPKSVTLLSKNTPRSKASLHIKPGDRVKTGQVLSDEHSHLISSVTGKVSAISPYAGDFGKTYTAVSIDVDSEDVFDEEFKEVRDKLTRETALKFFGFLPGDLPVEALFNREKPIHKIIIFGGNTDLLITTNQYIIRSEINAVTRGIATLKQLTGIDDIVIAVPRELLQGAGHTGAELKAVDLDYPSANPHIIMQKVFDQIIPAGEKPEDSGICFLSAESAAAVGNAIITGRIPVTKTLTLVKKNGSKALISARLGTPLKEILHAHNIDLKDQDRLIIGGPLTGSSVYSIDHPIHIDTDAVMIQDRGMITFVSDTPCVNCGECIRICPAKMPINMLVRFLEAGKYEEAADEYDLYSCIECGLCSFVCISRIPIFQMIRLAKHQLSTITEPSDAVESTDEQE